MYLKIVIFLLIQKFLCAPCSIAPLKYYPLANVTKCLRGVPFNATSAEIRNLGSTIKSYYESNPYVEWFRSPPEGYKQYAFDFVEEIDALNASKFSDGFEYYQALTSIFLKFKDGHVIFLPPCLWNYYYLLPIEIVVLNGDTSEDFLTPFFYIADGENSVVTPQVDIVNSQIISVDLDGGNNFVDIAKAVSDFAVKYGSVAYNTHANWNDAITYGLIQRNAAFYPPPAENITLRVILSGETTITTVSIPWYGLYAGDNRPSSLANLCPASAVQASGDGGEEKEEVGLGSDVEAAKAEKEEEGKGKGKSVREKLREIRRKILLDGKRKKKDGRFKNNREAVEYLKKKMSPASKSDTNFHPTGFAQLQRIHHENLARMRLERGKKKEKEKNGAEAKVEAELEAKIDTEDNVVLEKGIRGLVVPKAKMLSDRNIKERISKSTNKGSFTRLNNADTLTPVLEDEADELYMYIVPERRIGIVRLLSFLPDDEHYETFLPTFIESFERLAAPGVVDNIIIDVRGNNGGSGELLQALAFYLFPTLRPTDLDTSFPKTPFLNDIKLIYQDDEDPDDDSIFSMWNTTTRITDFYAATDTRTLSYLNGTTYKRDFTQRYLWDMGDSLIKSLKSSSPFDPHHVFIVSDAICYSACGVFTKLAQDTHSAKVLGYSFNPFYIDREGLELYNPGSCPALEFDSDTINSLRDPDYAEIFNNFKNFPPVLPRDDELIGYSSSEAYSINPTTRDQTLYFKNNSVDDVIPIFETMYDGTADNILDMAWYVDEAYIQPQYCFDWEVQIDDGRCVAPDPNSHQIWGHPCKNNDFDMGGCVFAFCQRGYFLSAPNECSLLPPWQVQ